jgi:hypothetical protein
MKELDMTFRHRVWMMGALTVAALAVYGTAKFYSPSLMIYVTEQTLKQKSPAGTDPEKVHLRLHAYLSSLPDSESKMAAVVAMSQYLEKVQQLSPEELNRLLEPEQLPQ